MGLGRQGSLAVGVLLGVVARGVVEAGLGVLLQLLGQVRAGGASGDVSFVTVLWDLQLFHKAHRPGR